MGFKKYDGSTWQSITPKKSKGIPYTGTLPATLTGTKAGYLHKYKIFGNTEQTGTPTPENPIVPQECGERTENLFDAQVERGGWAVSTQGVVIKNNGLVNRVRASKIIPINPEKTYTISVFPRTLQIAIIITDENGYLVSDTGWNNTNSQTIQGGYGACIAIRKQNNSTIFPAEVDGITGIEGSTAPTSYIPYGYKLPLTSSSTPVDIYIGDDTLSDVEYVDSGTGKIYRMVGGVLTPVDPPVSFPQIPTTANSTTISWAGEGLAPSEFDSIQEWVDIATYTYTNGEWVADNSAQVSLMQMSTPTEEVSETPTTVEEDDMR